MGNIDLSSKGCSGAGFASFQNMYLLSSLLPYDPIVKTRSRLKDGLKEFLMLLTTTEESLRALNDGALSKFDPLVGENACQIRAVKIALIALNKVDSRSEELLAEIAKSKAIVHILLNSEMNFFNIELSLQFYLDHGGLDISINSDEIFLISSYILSKTKVLKPFNPAQPLVENASTDAKKIKEVYRVGSAFSWKFIKHLREELSLLSVRFIRETASQFGSKPMGNIGDFEKFVTVHNGLQCFPYYWTARVLMEQSLKSKIPVVMIVEQKAKDIEYKSIQKTVLFFQPTSQGYKTAPIPTTAPDQPALILIGSTCRNVNELPDEKIWKKELLSFSLVDLIFAYSAAHRQYPDETKDQLIVDANDEQYVMYKSKAEEWGCSLKNPALFFLSHAFCDKIRNIGDHV